jgi:hypothetical protein
MSSVAPFLPPIPIPTPLTPPVALSINNPLIASFGGALYVPTILAPSNQLGVFKSTDGGTTWTVFVGPSQVSGNSLAGVSQGLSPNILNFVYADLASQQIGFVQFIMGPSPSFGVPILGPQATISPGNNPRGDFAVVEFLPGQFLYTYLLFTPGMPSTFQLNWGLIAGGAFGTFDNAVTGAATSEPTVGQASNFVVDATGNVHFLYGDGNTSFGLAVSISYARWNQSLSALDVQQALTSLSIGPTASVVGGSITSGGLGWNPGDTFSFNGGGAPGSSASGTVNTVSAGGVITAWTPLFPGYGYTAGDTNCTALGLSVGVGLVIDVSVGIGLIDAPNGGNAGCGGSVGIYLAGSDTVEFPFAVSQYDAPSWFNQNLIVSAASTSPTLSLESTTDASLDPFGLGIAAHLMALLTDPTHTVRYLLYDSRGTSGNMAFSQDSGAGWQQAAQVIYNMISQPPAPPLVINPAFFLATAYRLMAPGPPVFLNATFAAGTSGGPEGETLFFLGGMAPPPPFLTLTFKGMKVYGA